MRIAVLDLGTNTFNLLIAESFKKGDYQILYNHKIPVKLGQGGIHKSIIGSGAYARGINAISEHYQTLQNYHVDKIYSLGTAALRNADNGKDFVAEIFTRFGITIENISGEREAELIYLGVKQTLKLNKNPILILDIGGGSNEFIIANRDQIFWRKSYKLGVALLLEKFLPSDPITVAEIEHLKKYIDTELSELYDVAGEYHLTTLAGASGAFESFTAMIRENEHFESETAKAPHAEPITLEAFLHLYNKLIFSTIAERQQMKGLEPLRIEFIVLAALFTKRVVEKLQIREIIQSNFSMKEGLVYELLQDV
ncbi:MAG: hypothetical protein JXJ22_03570 [Bacteroidales bacterium]|nr:hypothetical protein [Bacteroidales bacterium]